MGNIFMTMFCKTYQIHSVTDSEFTFHKLKPNTDFKIEVQVHRVLVSVA